jgi:hypothetical protein
MGSFTSSVSGRSSGRSSGGIDDRPEPGERQRQATEGLLAAVRQALLRHAGSLPRVLSAINAEPPESELPAAAELAEGPRSSSNGGEVTVDSESGQGGGGTNLRDAAPLATAASSPNAAASHDLVEGAVPQPRQSAGCGSSERAAHDGHAASASVMATAELTEKEQALATPLSLLACSHVLHTHCLARLQEASARALGTRVGGYGGIGGSYGGAYGGSYGGAGIRPAVVVAPSFAPPPPPDGGRGGSSGALWAELGHRHHHLASSPPAVVKCPMCRAVVQAAPPMRAAALVMRDSSEGGDTTTNCSFEAS